MITEQYVRNNQTTELIELVRGVEGMCIDVNLYVFFLVWVMWENMYVMLVFRNRDDDMFNPGPAPYKANFSCLNGFWPSPSPYAAVGW